MKLGTDKVVDEPVVDVLGLAPADAPALWLLVVEGLGSFFLGNMGLAPPPKPVPAPKRLWSIPNAAE